MDSNILNVEQAMEFLGVSEKTLIKLLREEHVPARKIGREWRFSKDALIHWLSTGDSCSYINKNEAYQISQDETGESEHLLNSICNKIETLKKTGNVNSILDLDKSVDIPKDATLRVSYKEQREIQKFEFKVYWPLRDDNKINMVQNKNSL